MNNILKRGISGTVFLLVVVCGLLLDKFLFAALMLYIMVGMMYEFYHMSLGGDFRGSRHVAIFAGVTLFVLMFMMCAWGLHAKYLALTIVPLLVLMACSLYSKSRDTFWKFSHLYTGIIYIAIPLACSNLLVFSGEEFNGLPMLCFFVIIWASDVGAYLFGVSLGQKYGKKLCPEISPKKSWIGFWGGMLCAVLAAVVMKWVGWFEYSVLHCVLLAVVMDISGVYGDLFESKWKRCYDIKDSGRSIPGHGGLLDRFDSALMAIPAGVLYLMLFNLL
jgi:phosphatidate cytidylyltransferase